MGPAATTVVVDVILAALLTVTVDWALVVAEVTVLLTVCVTTLVDLTTAVEVQAAVSRLALIELEVFAPELIDVFKLESFELDGTMLLALELLVFMFPLLIEDESMTLLLDDDAGRVLT